MNSYFSNNSVTETNSPRQLEFDRISECLGVDESEVSKLLNDIQPGMSNPESINQLLVSDIIQLLD